MLFFGAGRETGPAATGTVALPKIRGDLRPFAVAVGLPRNLLCLNDLHIILYFHDENLTLSVQNRKTYRRFLGMIFFGGSGSLVITAWQRFATEKIEENRKNTKKNIILLGADPRFSAKTA
jgi:hypothetical protein